MKSGREDGMRKLARAGSFKDWVLILNVPSCFVKFLSVSLVLSVIHDVTFSVYYNYQAA
jgi:hypothetical protein